MRAEQQMHLSLKQLEMWIQSGVLTDSLREHYESCTVCQEEYLMLKTAIWQAAQPEVAQKPDDIFLTKLNKKLNRNPQSVPKSVNEPALKVSGQKFKILAGLLAAASVFVGVLFWKNISSSDNQVANHRLTFFIGKVTVNGKQAIAGQLIRSGAIIETGPKSSALLQLEQSGTVTIMAKTLARIESESVADASVKQQFSIHLFRGETFQKIVPASIKYRAKTINATAAVRGTSFSIQFKNGKSNIKLLDGKLEVSPQANSGFRQPNHLIPNTDLPGKLPESVILESKEKLSVGVQNSDKVKKLTKKELAILKSQNKAPLVKLPAISEPLAKLNFSMPKVAENIYQKKLPKNAKKNKKMTLAELEKKYGTLAVIHLKSGKSYKGAYKANGAIMTIISTEGVIKVNSVEVLQVEPLQ